MRTSWCWYLHVLRPRARDWRNALSVQFRNGDAIPQQAACFEKGQRRRWSSSAAWWRLKPSIHENRLMWVSSFVYILLYQIMIVNSIIHKIYLNIVSAIYKYWYKYICIHIYINIYIYICICSLWFLLSHYTNFYIMICIYIYIDINSYIMILYTCCDIKHACIHWTFGESNMPWARGLAN